MAGSNNNNDASPCSSFSSFFRCCSSNSCCCFFEIQGILSLAFASIVARNRDGYFLSSAVRESRKRRGRFLSSPAASVVVQGSAGGKILPVPPSASSQRVFVNLLGSAAASRALSREQALPREAALRSPSAAAKASLSAEAAAADAGGRGTRVQGCHD